MPVVFYGSQFACMELKRLSNMRHGPLRLARAAESALESAKVSTKQAVNRLWAPSKHRTLGRKSTRRVYKRSLANLQNELLRFSGRFSSRMRNVLSNDDQLAIRLNFESAVLGIALGPDVILNLLDMVAYFELRANRGWATPRDFVVASVFADSRADIWRVAGTYLSSPQRERLRGIIGDWDKAHPAYVDIDALRLSELSDALAESRRVHDANKGAQGLAGEIRGALASADASILFGERVLHFAQRVPFLARLHAKLLVTEVIEATLIFVLKRARQLLVPRGKTNEPPREHRQEKRAA